VYGKIGGMLLMEKEREVACQIIDEFEDILEAYDITMPSTDRKGEPTEARIYGDEYYALEDTITELIEDSKGDKKRLAKQIVKEFRDMMEGHKLKIPISIRVLQGRITEILEGD